MQRVVGTIAVFVDGDIEGPRGKLRKSESSTGLGRILQLLLVLQALWQSDRTEIYEELGHDPIELKLTLLLFIRASYLECLCFNFVL